jgi:hypothetical protein
MRGIQVVLILAMSSSLFIIGVACLFKTKAVREYAIKQANHRLNPFSQWMQSGQYLWNLRICGLLALAMSGIIAFAFFSNLN